MNGGASAAVPASFRRRLLAGVKAAALLALVAYLVYRLVMDGAALAPLASRKGFLVLLVAGIFCAGSLGFVLVRHVLLVRAAGGGVRAGDIYRAFAAGVFTNNFLPAATGFDLARIYVYSRRSSLPLARIGGILLADRISSLAGLIVCAATAQVAALATDMPHPLRALSLGLMPWVAGLMALFASGIVLALLGPRLFGPLAERFALWPWAGTFLEACRALLTRPGPLFGALVLSIACHSVAVLGVSILAWELFGPQAAGQALVAAPLVFFSALVPITPGGIGWTEAVADFAWHLFDARGGLVLFVA